MTPVRQSAQLLRILIKNTFNRKSKSENVEAKKAKGQKAAAIAGISIGVMVISFYMTINIVYITQASIQNGYHQYIPYLLIFLSQMLVLLLGAVSSLNVLYFSKDNSFLMSLPMKPAAIFGAKFTYTYLTELAVSAIVLIPMLIAYGVVCIANGIALGAWFFIVGVFSIFLITALPLLVISLLSIPLMYIVSFLKKRTLGNAFAALFLFAIGFIFYFAIINNYINMQMESMEGEFALPPQVASLLIGVAKYTVFNKPIVNSMLGVKPALNFFIYLVSTIGLTVLTVFLSSKFYRKGVAVTAEGAGNKPKKKQVERKYEGQSINIKKSFLKKELKTLANTPTMLINSVIGIVLGPILIIFTAGNGMYSEYGADGVGTAGMAAYMTALMAGVTNQVAVIGFSREGKNLLIMKSLPISATLFVQIKLLAATIISGLTVLTSTIAFIVISPTHNVLIALMIALVALSCSFGANCISLYYDLKNPSLRWHNINEVMKNNKKVIRPTFIVLGVGMFYVIVGFVLEFAKPFTFFWNHFLFYASSLILNAIFVIFSYKKLFNDPEGMMNSIEG